jgi:hypothetical protein
MRIGRPGRLEHYRIWAFYASPKLLKRAQVQGGARSAE